MILTKFGEDPIRTLGGVAFTRIDVRTYGRTDGEDDDNIRPPPAAYKNLVCTLSMTGPLWNPTLLSHTVELEKSYNQTIKFFLVYSMILYRIGNTACFDRDFCAW